MSNLKIYQSVWNKFLPVIAMKLRSAVKQQELQRLEMDKIDFEKASNRKNCKYQFDLELNEGRTLRSKTTAAIGLDFARALNEYEATREIIKSGIFKFNLNGKFILSISEVKVEVKAPAETV
ncbi:MAG TPA: hypothetical protein VJY62_02340 [Bacteroidia bacterium]|nr:hypothetical protein [Bacteroidia bacterium]